MKKLSLIFILFFMIFCHVKTQNNACCAYNNDVYEYIILCDDKTYFFKSGDFNLKLSKTQEKNFHNLEIIDKLEDFGLNKFQIASYIFPEIVQVFEKLDKTYSKLEISDKVVVKENQCKLEYIDGESSKCIDKQHFFDEFFEQIKSGQNTIKIKLKIMEYKQGKSAREMFAEKSSFSTNFETSSEERKNNIRVALSMFDGLVLEEGEVLSFNEITGVRNESTGYKPAKIISQGTFVLGYGGGVCQVSTTLYNACLLAGLEIIESTSHSLPVSYIEPSFDAMVNVGSSDLKIRNNSGGKIIITTSSVNDICKVKIYGLKNKYKITRQSEKISIIPAEPDSIETDYKKYNYELSVGEQKRVSFPKDGFISRGYLNYYDENGVLVERKFIRENKYNPTRGVILKREN